MPAPRETRTTTRLRRLLHALDAHGLIDATFGANATAAQHLAEHVAAGGTVTAVASLWRCPTEQRAFAAIQWHARPPKRPTGPTGWVLAAQVDLDRG